MNFFSPIFRWLRPAPNRKKVGARSARYLDSAERSRRIEAPSDPMASSGGRTPSAPSAPNDRIALDAMKSAIRKGFNSTQPVTVARQLHGRQEQMDLLIEGVLDRGNHAMIFGGRGTGKTSLARVFANVADNRGYLVFYMACEPGQSFTSLIAPFLDAVRSSDARAASAPLAPDPAPSLSPRDVVEILADHGQRKFIFVLDEYDRITDHTVQHELARLMKLLSDAALPVHIIAVGIASGLDQLIEGHESLRRHVSAIPIVKIETPAVFDLITRGATYAGLNFTDASRETIAHVACGSPYHVRLFCALACFETLRQRKTMVELSMALTGMIRSVDSWALTNPGNAALFRETIALGASDWPLIEKIARAAATTPGGFTLESLDYNADSDTGVMDLLAPALRVHPDDGEITFRDSLAPQFLLAMLLASQHGDHSSLRVINLMDAHLQSAAL